MGSVRLILKYPPVGNDQNIQKKTALATRAREKHLNFALAATLQTTKVCLYKTQNCQLYNRKSRMKVLTSNPHSVMAQSNDHARKYPRTYE